MDQIKQCMFFLVLIGCGAVLSEKTACETKEYESCAEGMAKINKTTTGVLCDGILDDALKCWTALEEKCQMAADQKAMADSSIKQIKLSKESCDTATTDPSKTDALAAAKADSCKALYETAVASSSQNGTCGRLDAVVKCMEGVSVNSLNETLKSSLTEMQEAVKKNMTDDKCCDRAAFTQCGEVKYDITNSTATDEICKNAMETTTCLTKELKTCEETAFKKPFEESLSKIKLGVEICKDKGFPSDGDSGTTIQPSLVILAAACLATITKLF